MWGMRMVATDLDGTIVGRNGLISERTLTALRACEAGGVHVVFVTGRPPRWMAPVVELTGHQGLALCGNGAVVLDLASDRVVRSSGFSPEVVLDVTERLRDVLAGATFALETLDGYRREPGYVPRHQAALAAATGTLAELLADRPVVIKILCRQGGPHEQAMSVDDMLAVARRQLAGAAEVVHSDPAGYLLEVSAPGVTKASALARLAADLGVAAGDVVAFGDMPNDVPMLLWAGAGYAMAGGHPDAIAAADHEAPPFAEDGVAQVLERLLAPVRDRP
jgi:Cof subfamily protein (haloacid dehalogenase superfamily)